MRQTVLVCLALSAAAISKAQTWNEDFLNQPSNLRYGSSNPTRIVYNSVRDFAVATVDYSLTRGDFHAIDASGRAHCLGAYVGGLRHIAGFDIGGHLSYRNRQDNDQRWNSTLWLMADNPFIICDSVSGDATTEEYELAATAAYAFSDKWHAAIEIGLRTGSRADQTDPRPRSATSILPITVGADYRLADSWTIGIAAGVKFYSQTIEHTDGASAAAKLAHRFFLMKGMGDYAKRSSGDESGYKRDYEGTGYSAAATVLWQPADGSWANFIEASIASDRQDANDGGISYSFHGGDYQETVATVNDRLQWSPATTVRHNLTVSASLHSGKGTWYDQKRQADLEHGGVNYYEVLNKSINHKSQRLNAALGYQLDLLRQDGRRDLSVKAEAAMRSVTRKQLLGDATPKQEIQMLSLQLQAGKTLYINKVALLAQLGGGYQTPQKQTYASGSVYTDEDNIDAVYTRRIFEYESAKSWHIGTLVDASMPVSDKLSAGVYAKCRYQRYSGNSEYWQGYDGTHLTTADFGAYIKF